MSSSAIHETAAVGFSKNAEVYEECRPTYPEDAVTHAVSLLRDKTDACSVVDLASGTGKLTRLLKPYFAHPSVLVGVEPVAEMRQICQQTVPGIEVVDGAADSLPFGKDSLDAIFIGQAFHWFATEATLREFHRVLKHSAPVIMLWNMEDKDTAEWVKNIRNEYEQYDSGCPQYRHGKWSEVWDSEFALEKFTPKEHKKWSWEHLVNKEYIWKRVASKSYIGVLDKAESAKLHGRIKKIVDQIPDEIIPYPHVTDLVWAYKK